MEISIIILCLILSTFFLGLEIAFISSNKIYLEIEKKQDNFVSKILTRLTESPSRFVASMLIGKSLSLVVYAIFTSKLILQSLQRSSWQVESFDSTLLQIAVVSLVYLFVSELIAKIFFKIYANSLIRMLALPGYFFHKIFFYISTLLLWISDVIIRNLFNAKGDQIQLYFSKVELGNYITEQMNALEDNKEVDSEIQIFQNALEFSAVKARDVMTPRTEIVSIELFESTQELRKLFIETGYSKVVITQGSLDDIIGYVHSFDLFKKPKTIKTVLMAVEFVPETILIKDALNLLIKKRKNIAVVLDEYGGTSGILTIEDIVEELFGEIEDEHDSDEELVEELLPDGSYLLSARHDVEYLNETYKLAIPEDDSYGTLGGFIVDYAKEIPQRGTVITIGNFHFIIEECSNRKIELVKLTIKE